MKEQEIFTGALELNEPTARDAYVKGACGHNVELYQRINQLLKEHEAKDSLLSQPPIENLVTLSDQNAPTEEFGSMIGPYKLLQKIGEGGMGVVYMAEQEKPMHRKVALKIIKLGMDTKHVIARFEAERQALAMMDHPNIARVLDGGATDSGRPYFVMELVKGVPITEFCDKNKLSTVDRLNLFGQVCKAIQSAHQKGVIHRDIKPSNILVTLHHGDPLPKVIDFGIAKATNQKLTEKTLFTNYAQLIGTPAYMSPEQAEMSSVDVDTRTDVYSLGVLLYELLTGTTPFPEKELLSQGYGEMQRIIVEQEPERPSLRMSTLIGEQQSIVNNNRAVELPLLAKQLRGDLDWIIMKALEKDRRRRYETANGMAEDIRRHLDSEPVLAARPTFAYQLSKLYQRHKPAMAAAGIALALVIGTVVSTAQAMSAKRARDHAELATMNESQLREQAQQLADERRVAAYVADMKAADELIGANLFQEGREILLKQRPDRERDETDLRGFEWRYLWDASRDHSLHQAVVPIDQHYEPSLNRQFGLTVSHDQTRVLVSSPGRKIHLMQVPTFQLVRTITLAGSPAYKPAFSPDDSKLYVIIDSSPVQPTEETEKRYTPIRSKNHSLLVYETKNWTLESRFDDVSPPMFFEKSGALITVSFKSDRAPSQNHFVQIKDGEMKPLEAMPDFELVDLNRSYQGSASAGIVTVRDLDLQRLRQQQYRDPQLRVWRLDRFGMNEELGTFPQASVLGPSAVSKGEEFIAYLATIQGGAQTETRLYNLKTGVEIPLENSLTEIASDMVFTTESSLLAVACRDRRIRIWNTQSGEFNGIIDGHPRQIADLEAIGQHAICLYRNGDLRSWDLASASQSRIESHIVKIHVEGFDARTLEGAPGPDVMDYFNPEFIELLQSKTISSRLKHHLETSSIQETSPEKIYTALSPNGGYLEVGSSHIGLPKNSGGPRSPNTNIGYTYYHTASEGEPLVHWERPKSFAVHEYPGYKVIGFPYFINDSELIVETEDQVELWDLKRQSQQPLSISNVILRGSVAAIPVVARHERLLAFSRLLPEGTTDVAIWDIAQDREVANYDCGFPIHLIQFSPDGSLLAVGNTGRTSIIDLESHRVDASKWRVIGASRRDPNLR